MSLAEALALLARSAGIHFSAETANANGRSLTSLRLWSPQSGPVRCLYLARGGRYADGTPRYDTRSRSAEEILAANNMFRGEVTWDYRGIVNAPVVIGDVKAPNRLLVDRQSLEPGRVSGSTQQLAVRFHVTACNGKPVQGALVYVTAVPYNQFSVPAESPTGSDGWAELQMNRLRGFPAANRQQLLVMFVRAREPGGNLLAGVSTRRLVSFPVDLGR